MCREQVKFDSERKRNGESGCWRAFGTWGGVSVCFKWEEVCLEVNYSSQQRGLGKGSGSPPKGLALQQVLSSIESRGKMTR